MITVGVVDDKAGVRNSFERLFNASPGFRCLFTCASGAEAVRVVLKQPPDVLLMDIEMPGMSGIECTVRLKNILPELSIMMVTVCESDDKVFQALRAGASGYLLKRSTESEVLKAVTDVVSGGAPMTSVIARKVVAAFQVKTAVPGESVELSPREREILDLLSTGLSNKELASIMNLSVETVYTYLKNIYSKLHVHCRTAAVMKYLGKQI